jgi:hypothetical protein
MGHASTQGATYYYFTETPDNIIYTYIYTYTYSGFGFRPHMGTSELFVPEGPKSQAGSRTGRLDLPTKSQWPFSE